MSKKQEWYLPDRDGNLDPIGPLSHEEVVEKLLSKQLRFDEFICGMHFEELVWKRIFEVKEFAPYFTRTPRSSLPKRRSRGLAQSHTGSNLDFGKKNQFRRFPRVACQCEVILHNHKTICIGQTIDMSEKGVRVKVENLNVFESGEEVVVTLRGFPGVGTFSVTSVIMRKISVAAFEALGIYFLRINPKIRRQIARYLVEQFSRKNAMEDQSAA